MENKQTPPLSSPSVEIMLQQILQAVQTSSDGLAQVRKECEELRRTNARLESQLVHHEHGHASSNLPAAASSSAAAKGTTLAAMGGAPAAMSSSPATSPTTPTVDAKRAPSVESVAPSATTSAASSPLSVPKAPYAAPNIQSRPPSTMSAAPSTCTKTPAEPSSPPSPFIGAVKPAYASGFARQPTTTVQSLSTEMKTPPVVMIRTSATTSSKATKPPANATSATPAPAPSAAARRQALASAQRAEPLPDEPSQFCRAPRGPYADLLRRAVC
ncbi:hypothetical protein K523DRAFT_371954 [Schizophyllum commune Tattone D]|nr:hypothetical protein K523DRAFT_371954 [Schizophyllum commune Tattone D]